MIRASNLGPSLLAALVLLAPAPPATPSRPKAKGASEKPREYYDFPAVLQAPLQPTPVRGEDGKVRLVYHMFLTNWNFADLVLKSVEVLDLKLGTSLARYGEEELADPHRFQIIPADPAGVLAPGGSGPRRIGSGRTAAVFFWLTLEPSTPLPSMLRHRFAFEGSPLVRLRRDSVTDEIGDLVFEAPPLLVRTAEKPLVLRAPLRGGPWVCSGGPAYDSYHQSLVIREGRVRMPERFACDFELLDASGNTRPADAPGDLTNAMVYGYGAEVLAAAEGIIAHVKDGVPENTPRSSGDPKFALRLSRETLPGNWISLDLGGNRFVIYTHLQPESIRVKTGDKVRPGQVLALLGNSGDSPGPQLHFHVADANSTHASEGLPFVFDAFDVAGEPRTMAMPLKDTILRFLDARPRGGESPSS